MDGAVPGECAGCAALRNEVALLKEAYALASEKLAQIVDSISEGQDAIMKLHKAVAVLNLEREAHNQFRTSVVATDPNADDDEDEDTADEGAQQSASAEADALGEGLMLATTKAGLLEVHALVPEGLYKEAETLMTTHFTPKGSAKGSSTAFAGTEAVNYLVTHLGITRHRATQIGRMLVDRKVIVAVDDKGDSDVPFADDATTFRFSDAEEFLVLDIAPDGHMFHHMDNIRPGVCDVCLQMMWLTQVEECANCHMRCHLRCKVNAAAFCPKTIEYDRRKHGSDPCPPQTASDAANERREDMTPVQYNPMVLPQSAVSMLEGGETKWGIRAPQDSRPVVVFVNRRSGGQEGARVIAVLEQCLHPCQIWDLAQGGPRSGLLQFKDVPHHFVLACGGDGTVGWVLSEIQKIDYAGNAQPPVAIMPLGTGNDLSRVMGWGASAPALKAAHNMLELLYTMCCADVVNLDRWTVAMSETTTHATTQHEAMPQRLTMINYLSFGVDAKIALSFHRSRESNPQRFKHQVMNKLWYVTFAAKAMVSSDKPLHQRVAIEVDDKRIDFGADVEAVILLNIPSYAGGSDPWGPKKQDEFAEQDFGDGLLEVVGLKGVSHIGRIQAHLGSGRRIAQGRRIVVTVVDENLPMQVDGEPWLQPPARIDVSLAGRSKMLRLAKKDRFQADYAAAEITPERAEQVASDFVQGLPMRERKVLGLGARERVFSGSEAIDWLMFYLKTDDRIKAWRVGQLLMEMGVFRPTSGKRKHFRDQDVLYKLAQDSDRFGITSSMSYLGSASAADSPAVDLLPDEEVRALLRRIVITGRATTAVDDISESSSPSASQSMASVKSIASLASDVGSLEQDAAFANAVADASVGIPPRRGTEGAIARMSPGLSPVPERTESFKRPSRVGSLLARQGSITATAVDSALAMIAGEINAMPIEGARAWLKREMATSPAVRVAVHNYIEMTTKSAADHMTAASGAVASAASSGSLPDTPVTRGSSRGSLLQMSTFDSSFVDVLPRRPSVATDNSSFVGHLRVTVLEGRDLYTDDSCDPYLIVECDHEVFKSRVVRKTRSPVFGEEFHFFVTRSNAMISITVLDRRIKLANFDPEKDFLGRMRLPVSAIEAGVRTDKWVPLIPWRDKSVGVRLTGSLRLVLEYRFLNGTVDRGLSLGPEPFVPPGAPLGGFKGVMTSLSQANHSCCAFHNLVVINDDGSLCSTAPAIEDDCHKSVYVEGLFEYFTTAMATENVEVFVQPATQAPQPWSSVGVSRTNASGRVVVSLPDALTSSPGHVRVRMVALHDHSFAAGSVFLLRKGAGVIVYDIDGTLTVGDEEVVQQAVKDSINVSHDVKLRKGAVSLVRMWASKGYLPLYLSGRAGSFYNLTRMWLVRHGFPPGAIHHTRTHVPTLPLYPSVGVFKRDYIRGLQDIGINVFAAYGNTLTDIKAYGECGIPKARTFIVGPHGGKMGTVFVGRSNFKDHVAEIAAFADAEVPSPRESLEW